VSIDFLVTSLIIVVTLVLIAVVAPFDRRQRRPA
jgi:hypothetical protein